MSINKKDLYESIARTRNDRDIDSKIQDDYVLGYIVEKILQDPVSAQIDTDVPQKEIDRQVLVTLLQEYYNQDLSEYTLEDLEGLSFPDVVEKFKYCIEHTTENVERLIEERDLERAKRVKKPQLKLIRGGRYDDPDSDNKREASDYLKPQT